MVSLDTPGVIRKVASLFRGHNELIKGFNTFLPPGYRIDSDPSNPFMIAVTTPTGTTHHSTAQEGSGPSHSQSMLGLQTDPHLAQSAPPHIAQSAPVAVQHGGITQANTASPSINASRAAANVLGGMHRSPSDQKPPVAAAQPSTEFNHAIRYINRIKTRYADEPDTYKAFLEILQTYQKQQKAGVDVVRRFQQW